MKKVIVTITTEGTKVRVMVNGSPLVNCDVRDYPGGITSTREARKDAEHLARISVEALRLAGLEVEATSHGYNL